MIQVARRSVGGVPKGKQVPTGQVDSRHTPTDPESARAVRERLRRRYRPGRVRLLFIGESPPASGRFFYRCDSGLYRALLGAFREWRPSIGDGEFLEVFRSAGCYLIDLCPFPVDQLEPHARRAACRDAELLLSRQIRGLRPELVATVVQSIRGNVTRALAGAGWHGRVLDLPYPGRWSRFRDTFVMRLVPELRALYEPDP